MDLSLTIELKFALPKMLDPILASMLELGRWTPLYKVAMNLTSKGARGVQATNVFP